MIRTTLFILFLLAGTTSLAQKIQLINIDQLEKRIDAGRDTIYIINLWATWCAPCIKELPYFDKLQQEHKNEKLKVLLVSVDFISQLEKTVQPFIDKIKPVSETYLLNETEQQEYIERIDANWSGSIPATLVIQGSKRRFIESELDYEALLKLYQTIKQ